MKRKIILLFLIAFMCLFCGCARDYGNRDVKQYVKEKYDLKKITVGPQVKINDSDSYWVVTIEGEDGFDFIVEDRHIYDLFHTNQLLDDYEDRALIRLFEAYGDSEYLSLSVESEPDNGIRTDARLTGTYHNKQELEAVFAEIKDFLAYKDRYTTGVSVLLDIDIVHPMKDYNNYNALGNFGGYYMTFTEEDCERAMRDFLLVCIDYRYEDFLAEFSQEEIEAALEGYIERVAIARDGSEEGEYEWYTDLCGDDGFDGVSFGTLFEILKREGYEGVEGNLWHYSFVGVDGCVYEISYDFCDYSQAASGEEHREDFYCLKDGQKIFMEDSDVNHFSEEEVKVMTGFVLKYGRMEEESEE